MLLPQYRLRTLFAVTLGCALAAWVARQAYAGEAWAWSVFGTMLFAGFLFFVYGFMFAIAWFASAAMREPVYLSADSPFGERPPEFSLPEVLPGKEPPPPVEESPFREEG